MDKQFIDRLLALGWQPMSTAPKTGKILAWCDDESDDTWETIKHTHQLSLYKAHCEGFSCAEDGPNVIQWGGGWDDRSYFEPDAGWLSDWWFLVGSDFEVVANPIVWMPIPGVSNE